MEEKSRKEWWKPKGFLGWFFALFIVLPLAIAAWPITLPVVIVWFFLKQDKEGRKKILKFAGIGLGTLLFLVIIGTIFLPEELTKKEVNQEASPTPTAKPTPTAESEACTLQANVGYSETQLEISNLSNRDWQNVKVEVNSGVIRGGYSYKVPIIEAGTKYTIGLAKFADSKGNRFNPFEKVVQNVFITEGLSLCDYFAEVK